MRILRPIVTVLVLLVLLPSGAVALDGEREGFVVGLGLGPGSVKQSYDVAAGGPVAVSEGDMEGVALGVRVGAGLDDRWFLQVTSRSLLFNEDFTPYSQSFHGIGAAFFLRPQAPSFCADLGLGTGVRWNHDTGEAAWAPGVLLGLGYEFSRHLLLEFDAIYADVDAARLADINVTGTSWMLLFTINWLGY